MLASALLILATYNVLHPFYAVEWGERLGLNHFADGLSKEELRALTLEDDSWKKYSNWEKRCPFIAQNIQKADVVCLQEVSRETLAAILTLLPGYELASEAYHPNFTPSREFGNAIVFKKDKINLHDAFQISQGNIHTGRAAACAIFEFLGKKIKVASIHLSGYDSEEPDLKIKEESREKGFRQLQHYVGLLEENLDGIDALVIAGDLNEDFPKEPTEYGRLEYLMRHGFCWDQHHVPTEAERDYRIDWLFYKSGASNVPFKLTPMQFEKEQWHASDHLMTGTAVAFEDLDG